MSTRACVLLAVLWIAGGVACAQSVESSAVARSLVDDIRNARAQLEAGCSPWQDPAGRPRPEPLAVLRQELPGNHIWKAFKPVDRLVREAYRLQRQGYIVKDAAVAERREARALLPALAEAITLESPCYNRRVTSTALRQVSQADYALRFMQYQSALCVLWSMADLLGLWDRQAALEVAEEHVGEMQRRGSRARNLRPNEARRMSRRLDVISRMIDTAVCWQPLPESIGPGDISPRRISDTRSDRHFASHARLGAAFDPWRDGSTIDGSATPLVYDETNLEFALSFPPQETECLHVRPKWRDWQRQLNEYRYGWVAETNTAAGQWAVCCDWRRLLPESSWPGARGIDNAGGL